MPETEIEAIARKVRDRLKTYAPEQISLDVEAEGIHNENGYWYVPVRPSREPARRYAYYETLADIESELADQDNLKVLLVPAISEEAA